MFLPLTELEALGGLPGIELNQVIEMLSRYFLASLRIGAFLVSAPLFGSRSIPVQVRIVAAGVLGSVVMGLVDVPSPVSYDNLLKNIKITHIHLNIPNLLKYFFFVII